MHPVLAVIIAAAAGAALGWWQRRNLATLGYRLQDEIDQPVPGPRWWVVWASMLAAAGLTATAALSPDPAARLPLVPLLVSGAWLAAVDLDVLRLPNRVLAPTAVLTGAAVGYLAWSTHSPSGAILALVGGATAGGMLAVIHFASRGELGFGDVKLAAVIGISLGPLGLGRLFVALLVGSAAAVVWIKATGQKGSHHPYGPWLLAGAWVAALLPA